MSARRRKLLVSPVIMLALTLPLLMGQDGCAGGLPDLSGLTTVGPPRVDQVTCTCEEKLETGNNGRDFGACENVGSTCVSDSNLWMMSTRPDCRITMSFTVESDEPISPGDVEIKVEKRILGITAEHEDGEYTPIALSQFGPNELIGGLVVNEVPEAIKPRLYSTGSYGPFHEIAWYADVKRFQSVQQQEVYFRVEFSGTWYNTYDRCPMCNQASIKVDNPSDGKTQWVRITDYFTGNTINIDKLLPLDDVTFWVEPGYYIVEHAYADPTTGEATGWIQESEHNLVTCEGIELNL